MVTCLPRYVSHLKLTSLIPLLEVFTSCRILWYEDESSDLSAIEVRFKQTFKLEVAGRWSRNLRIQ